MYSTHNEGKSVVAERFIRTLMNKIYKYITSMSKNLYIDKLNYTVNKYNNTYNRTIKMKPVNVKSNIYINSTLVKKLMIKILNLKSVTMLEYQNIKTVLQKAMFQSGLKETYMAYCVVDMLLVVLTGKKLLERFTIKNYKKQAKKSWESNKEKRR